MTSTPDRDAGTGTRCQFRPAVRGRRDGAHRTAQIHPQRRAPWARSFPTSSSPSTAWSSPPIQWHFPYFNDEMERSVGEGLETTEVLLMGRVVYEEWASQWPTSDDEPNASMFNDVPKYVVSSTLSAARRRWFAGHQRLRQVLTARSDAALLAGDVIAGSSRPAHHVPRLARRPRDGTRWDCGRRRTRPVIRYTLPVLPRSRSRAIHESAKVVRSERRLYGCSLGGGQFRSVRCRGGGYPLCNGRPPQLDQSS